MRPDIVADVGNSRIKWGQCNAGTVTTVASLPPDDAVAWTKQLADWQLEGPQRWAISGVDPWQRDRLQNYLRDQGHEVTLIADWQQLPLQIQVEHPGKVGIDRLLNAVSVNTRRSASRPAVIVDAGSAVTVDWINKAGVFQGGAILPGLRLMSQALHDHTALLPLVKVNENIPRLPATSTPAAVEAGIFWAVVGGIERVIDQLLISSVEDQAIDGYDFFLAGGDGPVLEPALKQWATHGERLPHRIAENETNPANFLGWPKMTLEGIRLTAEARA